MTRSPEGRPEGMAAPESATPEKIAVDLMCNILGMQTDPDWVPDRITWEMTADTIRLYAERRGEEERAKALEEMAQRLEEKAFRQKNEHSCQLVGATYPCAACAGIFAIVTCAEAIRSLAAAPSGDALGLNWYQRADGYWNADCGCGSTLCGWEVERRAYAEAEHARVRQGGFRGCGPRAIAQGPAPSGDATK